MPPLEVPAERSREAESADVLQFVWVYWHGGAKAMSSVVDAIGRKALRGPLRFTVIGDRPPWYAGHVIPATLGIPPAAVVLNVVCETCCENGSVDQTSGYRFGICLDDG